MKAKHFRFVTAVLAVMLVIALGMGVYAASSSTSTQDGLTAVLSTDKETYTGDDLVTVTLDVTNNSGKEASINSEITVPSGMVIKSGSAAASAKLNGGSTNTNTLVLSIDTASETGDSAQLILWIMLAVLSVGGIALLMAYGKNGKSFISLVLCLAMVGSLAAAVVPAQAAEDANSLSVSHTIKVDDADVTIKATVSYTLTEEETEDTVYTRAELEDTLMATAWAYFLKEAKLQYGSQIINWLDKYYGGTYRLTEDASPEYGTSDTTIYSVCSDFVYKVYYEALGYRLFGSENYMGSTTTDFWLKSEDTALFRWLKSGYSLNATDEAWGVTDEKVLSTEDACAYLADWENNLRVGDVIVATGHAFLYVGNGYVMDCWGGKYDTSTGVESFEENGSVHVLHTIENLYLNGKDPVTNSYHIDDRTGKNWFVVFRPLDAFVEEASETDKGEDVINLSDAIEDAAKLDAAASRLAYPAMEIDRTVDITPYGAISTNGVLTYNVAVSNKSNDPQYLTYCQSENQDYAGESYTDLVVTETIPEGTELVEGSITNNGTYADGVITWTVDITAGQSVDLSYQVKVTAGLGSTVVNDGGFVANIPSNSISNTVGGAKLSESALANLAALAGTSTSEWREKYNISRLGTDLEFAERVYQAAMGIGLELPTVQEIMDNLFTFETITNESCSPRYEGTQSADLFTVNETVSKEYQIIADMIVDGYYGGAMIYSEENNMTMNEFSFDYLEAGDILVYVDIDDTEVFEKDTGKVDENGKPIMEQIPNENYGNVMGTQIIVYAGDGKLLLLTSDGTSSVLTVKQYNNDDAAFVKLWNALAMEVFFLLRPTEVYEDINTLNYDTSKEPVYGEEPADPNSDPEVETAYKQINSMDDVTDGKYIVVIEVNGKYYAMSGTTPDNCKFTPIEVTIDGGVVTTEDVDFWNLVVTSSDDSKAVATLETDLGYLVRTESSSNIQYGAAPLDWTITYDETNSCFRLENVNGDTRYLMYSGGNSGFKAYKAETDDRIGKVLLFKETVVADKYAIVVDYNGTYKGMSNEEAGSKINSYVADVQDGKIVTEDPDMWNVITVDNGVILAYTGGVNPVYLAQELAGKTNLALTGNIEKAIVFTVSDGEVEGTVRLSFKDGDDTRYLMFRGTLAKGVGQYGVYGSKYLNKTSYPECCPDLMLCVPGDSGNSGDTGDTGDTTVSGYKQINSMSDVTDGKYVIAVKNGDSYLYVSNSVVADIQLEPKAGTVDANGIFTAEGVTYWNIAVGADGKVTVCDENGNYLVKLANKNDINVSTTAEEWILTYDEASASFRLQSTMYDNRYLGYASNNNCVKAYVGTTSYNIQLLLFKWTEG